MDFVQADRWYLDPPPPLWGRAGVGGDGTRGGSGDFLGAPPRPAPIEGAGEEDDLAAHAIRGCGGG